MAWDPLRRWRSAPAGDAKPHSRAIVREDFPEIGIPENPALLHDGQQLWIAYELSRRAAPDGASAVLLFETVIDHRLAPINDEGLGQHPCAGSGLTFYAFHEVLGSSEAVRWAPIGGRHWILTFKDVTLDIVGSEPRVLTAKTQGSPLAALIAVRAETVAR